MDKTGDRLCVDFYGRNVEYSLEEMDALWTRIKQEEKPTDCAG